jgi:sec-independent protein translocase protein TatB
VFDIGTPELLLLIVLAVILFGPERLPDLARRIARMLHYLRRMAANAQQQLKDELGPDFSNLDVRDLNPRTFVQKHLLDEVEPVVADVKKDLADVGDSINGAKPVSSGGPQDAVSATIPDPPQDATAATTSGRASAPFDSDAT